MLRLINLAPHIIEEDILWVIAQDLNRLLLLLFEELEVSN